MPKDPEKAQKAKEKKDKKLLEQQEKESQEKCTEGRAFLEPEGKNVQPNYAKAIACFGNAIELHPGSSEAFTFRGIAMQEQKNYPAAIEDFTKGFTLNPSSVSALEGRAGCYEALKEWDRAIHDYSTVLAIHPGNDHAYNMRGCARLRKRIPGLLLKNADFEAVVSDFRNAIRLNENNYYAHTNLGKAYADQRRHKEAVLEFSQALRLKEDYLYAIYRRACSRMVLAEELLDVQKAQRAVRTQLPPEDLTIDVQIAREDEWDRLEKNVRLAFQSALDDFQKIINPEEKEKELGAFIHVATCHFLQREWEKAREEFQVALKLLPVAAESMPPEEVLSLKLLAESKLKQTEAILTAKREALLLA